MRAPTITTVAPPRVFIGTAGWGIPRDHAAAFPRVGSGLQKYASVLGAVEINSTFYRRHRPTTFERWSASVPASFRFAVKVPRAITHEAALGSPHAALDEFFGDVRGLGSNLGPVLVQLPASIPFQARRVAAFFRTMRHLHDGDVVCEPRHASWYEPAASAVFADYRVARVAADPPRPANARATGESSSLLYFRWHGSPRCYWSAYDDARLAFLADRIARAPAATSIWCVFDNTASGAAAGDALRLAAMLR